MIITLILTAIFAKIRGYKLKPLLTAYELYPIYAFELFSIFLQANIFLGNYSYVKWAGFLKPFYLALYLIPIIKYQLYKQAVVGSVLIFIGTAMNKIVIAANGGRMPIYPTLTRLTGYYDPVLFEANTTIHMLGGAGTKLAFLADWIDVGYSILSIGDLFIRAFTAIVLFYTIKAKQETIIHE